MQTRSNNTIVAMPDNSHMEVTYYCMDSLLTTQEKQHHIRLFIQLHDSFCTLKIEKEYCSNQSQLESIVHNKVINTKGFIC